MHSIRHCMLFCYQNNSTIIEKKADFFPASTKRLVKVLLCISLRSCYGRAQLPESVLRFKSSSGWEVSWTCKGHACCPHSTAVRSERTGGVWRCTRAPPAVSLPSRCSRNHADLHHNNVMLSGSKHIPCAWLNKWARTGIQHLFLSPSLCLSILLSLPSYCCCLPLSPNLSLCLSVLFSLNWKPLTETHTTHVFFWQVWITTNIAFCFTAQHLFCMILFLEYELANCKNEYTAYNLGKVYLLLVLH